MGEPIPKSQSARKAEATKGTNVNKIRGTAVERRVAKAVGGKRVPTSGAGSIKGDVLSRYVLYECKMSARVDARGAKVISLQREWLIKMCQEAKAEQKLIPVLVLHYFGDTKDYACLPFDTLSQMLAQLEGLYTLIDWLERHPEIAKLLPEIEMPGIGKPLFSVEDKGGE